MLKLNMLSAYLWLLYLDTIDSWTHCSVYAIQVLTSGACICCFSALHIFSWAWNDFMRQNLAFFQIMLTLSCLWNGSIKHLWYMCFLLQEKCMIQIKHSSVDAVLLGAHHPQLASSKQHAHAVFSVCLVANDWSGNQWNLSWLAILTLVFCCCRLRCWFRFRFSSVVNTVLTTSSSACCDRSARGASA
jgi:hypothetical protein